MHDLSWLTPEIAAVQAAHRERFDALFRGEELDRVPAIAGRNYGYSHGLHGTNDIDMLHEPDAWLADVLSDMAANSGDFADPVTFRPLVIELDPLGVHFIDALFGAETYIREGQYWSAPLGTELGELEAPDLGASEIIARTLELARRTVDATRGQVLIAPPVFSCPINVGINLFGERLLTALAQRPDDARHALRIITDVIGQAVGILMEAVPEQIRRNSVACNRYAPPGFGQIDGCATQLVSGRHYDEFFAALDEELLAIWPRGGMVHLCGAHEQHFETWARMESLRSVQVNDRASEDFELLHSVLRSDQIVYVGPTETMTVARILGITGGRRVVLQCVSPVTDFQPEY